MLFILFSCFLLLPIQTSNSRDYTDWQAHKRFSKRADPCSPNENTPIDLRRHNGLKSDFQRLSLQNYNTNYINIRMINNGHTVQLDGFPKSINISGGPLAATYVLEQMHFKWWSEHTMNGLPYPLECHIVHRNAKYKDLDEAAKNEDGIAIVAIIYHYSNMINRGIIDILKHIHEIKERDKANVPVKIEKFRFGKLIPKQEGYFTYNGSLLQSGTCAKNVIWIVLHYTFPVTLRQVKKFRQVQNDMKINDMKKNFRKAEKRQNQVVISVSFDDNQYCDKSDNSLHVSLGSLIVVFMMVMWRLRL